MAWARKKRAAQAINAQAETHPHYAPELSTIHDRMPVILDDGAAEDWMNPREQNPASLKRLLVPASDEALEMRLVSPLVNSVKNDGPELLETAAGS